MLTQKKLSQLITYLATMSAAMNGAAATNELIVLNDVDIVPVRPDWLLQAAQDLQNAVEDLESLLDDDTPIERPPRAEGTILALVREKDDTD